MSQTLASAAPSEETPELAKPGTSLPEPTGPRRHHTLRRWAVAVVAGCLAAALVPATVAWPNRVAVGWLVGAGLYLVRLWYRILRVGPAETRHRAVRDDPGRAAILIITVAASALSLLAAARVIARARGLTDAGEQVLWTVVGCAAVATSWLLTHSVYALRYAHLYYRRGHSTSGEVNKPGGMIFPGAREPCDLDFAYFAFTLGICFQTSDVAIDCTRVRRAVLFHVLLAFAYNTTILGLVIGLLGSWLQ